MTSKDLTPPVGLDAVLQDFARSRTPERRAKVGRVLASLAPYRDDRILAALVRVLEENPQDGVSLLRDYGDPRGGEHVSRAFDRIARGDLFCTCHLAEMLELAAATMEILGTELSSNQFLALDLAQDRADTLALQEHEHGRPPPAPIRAEPRPGRNAPCPCGSGLKFKKCCLGLPRS